MTRNWAEILAKPMPESPTAAQMLSYVKGYILALEDVLGDIRELDDLVLDANVASQILTTRVHRSLEEARQTLERLQ